VYPGRDIRPCRGRVLDAIGQRFLDYPVGHGVHSRIERRDWSGEADANLQARSPRPVRQRLDVAEPWAGGVARLVAAPEGTDEPAQVRKRLTARALDGLQRGARPLRVGRGDRPRPADLDNHDAQAMRDHVMQLACHPVPLLAGRQREWCSCSVSSSAKRCWRSAVSKDREANKNPQAKGNGPNRAQVPAMLPIEPEPGSNVISHAVPDHTAKQAAHHRTCGRERARWPRM
jgi:hypothetical protein